jgi:hypothetical protein
MPLLFVNLKHVSKGGNQVAARESHVVCPNSFGGSHTFPYTNYEYGLKIKIYI